MPNTLIHIAVQAPLSRVIFRKAEIPWILAGAIIPDIPWIFQRLFLGAGLADPYQARLYFTAQASFLFCLILALAVSFFSTSPRRTFALLAVNVFFHLALDALQIKWGNGVHLLAPFSWQSLNLGLIWPEHTLGYIVSFLGIIYLAWTLPEMYRHQWSIRFSAVNLLSALLLLLYFTLPVAFMDGLEKGDPSYTRTLREVHERTGKRIELDRSYFSKDHDTITTFAREQIAVQGSLPEHSGTISARGKFISPSIIHIEAYHHHNNYRDTATRIGLGMVLLIYGALLYKRYFANRFFRE